MLHATLIFMNKLNYTTEPDVFAYLMYRKIAVLSPLENKTTLFPVPNDLFLGILHNSR